LPWNDGRHHWDEPGYPSDRLLGSVELVDRLHSPSTAWLWQSTETGLVPIGQIGHYLAFEVKLRPTSP
jgi:hypothetical protein